jgi:hypothetical protein
MLAVFLLPSHCTYLCAVCTGLCVCLVCINSPYSSHICECWPRDQSTARPTTQNIHFSIHSQAPFYACLLVLSILIKQSQIGISDVFCLTLTAAKNDFFAMSFEKKSTFNSAFWFVRHFRIRITPTIRIQAIKKKSQIPEDPGFWHFLTFLYSISKCSEAPCKVSRLFSCLWF